MTLAIPMAPVSPEVTTPIKPSEALRLGRLLRPRQLRRQMFDGDDGACALGAIAIGLGFDPDDGAERGYRFLQERLSPDLISAVLIGNDVNGNDDVQIVTFLQEQGF